MAILACLHILTITSFWPLVINSMHTRLEAMRQHDLNETSFTPMVIVEHNYPKEKWNENILRGYLWVTF